MDDDLKKLLESSHALNMRTQELLVKAQELSQRAEQNLRQMMPPRAAKQAQAPHRDEGASNKRRD